MTSPEADPAPIHGTADSNTLDAPSFSSALLAASGVPAVAKLEPKTFGKLISYSETALGATLLTPFIPSRLAGAGLTAFSANLMTMYFRNPDMHDKAFRPTQDGQQLANNIVMLGAGLALLFSGKKK